MKAAGQDVYFVLLCTKKWDFRGYVDCIHIILNTFILENVEQKSFKGRVIAIRFVTKIDMYKRVV